MRAGFLKLGSEMVVLFDLAVGFETDDDRNILLVKTYICFHEVLLRDALY